MMAQTSIINLPHDALLHVKCNFLPRSMLAHPSELEHNIPSLCEDDVWKWTPTVLRNGSRNVENSGSCTKQNLG
jgi:hypothetical protein